MEHIYTVGDGRTFLEEGQLQRLSSITAVHEYPNVSDKYSFFSTMNLINSLRTENWLPVKVSEQRVTSEDRRGFQKHMVRFRQPGLTMDNIGDIIPELVLTNSHDARAAFILMAGFFRLACLNGLIVSDSEFASIHIRHVGYKPEDIIEATYQVVRDIPRLVNRVQEYKQIELKSEEREKFAESALIIKYAETGDSISKQDGWFTIGNRTFSIPALLNPTRHDDMGHTLWDTFNTVQAKIVHGNRFERTTRTLPNGRVIQRRKVQGIRGINEDIRVNKALWHLTEEMGRLKQAV